MIRSILLFAFFLYSFSCLAAPAPRPHVLSAKEKVRQDFIVMLDPGHGGADSGAIGANNTQEKVVTLAIAKKLASKLNGLPGIKAYLTRTDDHYVGLNERTVIARQKKADIFISLHADSFINNQANGASVFILSKKGASSNVAKWLADNENDFDMHEHGVDLVGKDIVLGKILMDLTKNANENLSNQLASNILRQLGKQGDLHSSSVQSAKFAVLKSTSIPSVLVEMAFISNQSEENRLTDPKKQNQITLALYSGISQFINNQ